MRIKVISCAVMSREFYLAAAKSENTVDISFLPQGLHETPDKLRTALQEEITKTDAGDTVYDAIVLGYCLCSYGISGITSSRFPIVVARGHDCITLLLGSKKRYSELFDSASGGIYWYSPGWIEHSLMPGRERYEKCLAEYTEKYGEDNAQFLMETEQAWMKEYSAAFYVALPELTFPAHIEFTKAAAEYLGWRYDSFTGDNRLIDKMISNDWTNEEFLVIPLGKTVAPSYDSDIIKLADPERP